MDRYKFLNEIITDYVLFKTLEEEIRDTLLLYSHKDDLRVLSNKIKEQWGYSFDFEYLDFNKKNVISLYGNNNDFDVIATLNSEKNISLKFRKGLKPNFYRYLFLKVWAYDVFEMWNPGDEIKLSVKKNFSEYDELAERLAISLTVSNTAWNAKLWGATNIKLDFIYLEPELEEIKKKEYVDKKGMMRRWNLVSVMKK
ncbi:hypothetical protein EI71_00680 [Anaeroplasma bactoclasticum]|jgi:hypothetical protein|uniref:Uncharacterized protein n=1 Tax=Anaeroplasma bactoclasticum TaxID=2088 RepID=A0A397S1S2_9MOLU|nr:hypothetical protein [Anaeroplasma bactoclasticum]RIA77897.1 hypothetical protein EI71_00680 [Anaeroplasma bactoclasticum]